MSKRFKQFWNGLKKITNSRLGIIISAAIVLELIGIVQYYSMRNIQREGEERRVRTELGVKAQLIANTLERAEATLQEHLWDIQTHLDNPDAMFDVTSRLISANKQIVGGCIAFVPNFYPQKGRLFEPYATKKNGTVTVEQLGSADHDYTQHPAFIKAVNERQRLWSDPYEYEGDTLTTFTYPITDQEGKMAAACGLDINLTWLSDTLNVHHTFPSSFGMMFTKEGKIVVRPPEGQVMENDLEDIVSLIRDSLAARKTLPTERSRMVIFTDNDSGRKGCAFFTVLRKEPHWVIVTVNYYDEVYRAVKQIRFLNMLMMLAGLLILFFIISRFARSERKLQEVGIQQARIGSELRIASGIQEAMLPKTFPPYPERKDIDIYGSLSPAKEVGGDLFDFFIRDEKLFFCIGDVSGKGVPSAIVMAMVQKLFRMASAHENNSSLIVQTMNEELSRDNTTNMFITFFLGILDLPTGRLRYCNAGHDNPMIIRYDEKDTVMSLPVKTNLPIGVLDNYQYAGEEFQIANECTLFLYTDGLTEAKNGQREQFRLHRVTEVLTRIGRSNALAPRQVLMKMKEEVVRFIGDAGQSDDLTMLAISYKRPTDNDILQKSMTLQNDITQVPLLNQFIKQFSSEAGISKKEERQLQLAVEEVVVNVMSYAYPVVGTGDIMVTAAWNGQQVKITITDNGVAFDPTLSATPETSISVEERTIGGLGILLTRHLVDSINYERIDGQNILTLRKKGLVNSEGLKA